VEARTLDVLSVRGVVSRVRSSHCCDSSIQLSIEEVVMWQQGQVFKLKAKGVDGQPLWAYRYRLEGRGSGRPQVSGFATRGDALKALEKVLARLGPGGRPATMTLGELVDEYLEMHQAER
jgi:hypothetical protein